MSSACVYLPFLIHPFSLRVSTFPSSPPVFSACVYLPFLIHPFSLPSLPHPPVFSVCVYLPSLIHPFSLRVYLPSLIHLFSLRVSTFPSSSTRFLCMCLPSFSAAKPTVSEETAKIWSLSASDVVDEEIVSKLLHMQSHQYHSLPLLESLPSLLSSPSFSGVNGLGHSASRGGFAQT